MAGEDAALKRGTEAAPTTPRWLTRSMSRPWSRLCSRLARCHAVQRGDLYVYVPVIPRPGISIMRLIVSSAAINDVDIPWVIGLHLIDDHDPMSLLVPRIWRSWLGRGDDH